MTDQLHPKPRGYSASVEFLSDGWPYAREVYQVEASDECGAERLAHMCAEDSVYFDLRIPDLATSIAVDPADFGAEDA
ncbi:hypothetical protein WG907_06205 [Sphingobium sp. AN558]|uniref:hypothetical protein n=1 Tax=Sphingobium sp. AN558 TaxID=3133442 RepID=UPI0030BDACB0